MSTGDSADVEVFQEGSVLVIALNRPEAKNAMTRDGAELVASALDRLDAVDELSVGVITGNGGTFCAGMDLKRYLLGETAVVADRGFGGLTLKPPVKPLIAAVEGYALGGGFEMALACDVIVAAESAQFGLPEVRRGLVARGGGLVRLPRRLPLSIALELILTGATLGASRAASFGLVNRVVRDGEAFEAALDVARTIASNAPMAVAASKRVVYEALDWASTEWSIRQVEIVDPVFASEDAQEGARAFAEKRGAIWRNA